MGRKQTGGAPGPATDSGGNPVLDPTQNVLDLVAAGMRRQDDLRQMQAHYTEKLASVQLAAARRESELRHKYEAENRALEADRLNAIRQVDQQNVQHAAEVQQAQAAALAAQVVALADAVRAGQTAAIDPLTKDIADLRRAQYEQAGQKAQTIEKGAGNRSWIGLVIAGAAALSAAFLGTAGIVITVVLTLVFRK